MSATCGPTSPEPLAYYDPETSCWRMSGGMFPSASMPSLATLPAWGTTRRGALYELPTPALPTTEPASSSLLPTPNVPTGGQRLGSAEQAGRTWVRPDGSKVQLHLTEIERLLPTPAAQEPGGTAQAHLDRKNRLDGANRVTPTHLAFITALLPTPAVNDMGAGKTVEAWDEWTEKMQAKHGNGNGHGPSLSIEAQRLLPTPKARDVIDEGLEAGRRRMGRYSTSSISTRVRSLGVPMGQPSDSGSASPDDQPPDLLTLTE